MVGVLLFNYKINSNNSIVTIVLAEKEFSDLFLGVANPQKLFMSGKLKIKGNIMKALQLQPVLGLLKAKAKL